MNVNNPRALFKITNRALHRKEKLHYPPPPTNTSEIEITTEFHNIFEDMIQSIQDLFG